ASGRCWICSPPARTRMPSLPSWCSPWRRSAATSRAFTASSGSTPEPSCSTRCGGSGSRRMELPEPAAAAREAEADPTTGLVEFAAAASHDLSTPLQLISGYADMLEARLDPRDPEAQAAMDG